MGTKWKAKGTAPLTVRVRVRVLALVLVLAQAMSTCEEGTQRAQCLCISASQCESVGIERTISSNIHQL